MTQSSDDASRVDPPVAGSYSRRSALILGGMGLGAAIAGGAILNATPSLADERAVALGAEPFEIVIAVYREGTLLDFAGPSDIFHRIPNTRVRFASLHGGPVSLEYGIVFGETLALSDIQKADLLLVPGGRDLREPMSPAFQEQLVRLGSGAKHITSVCTGSLALAATGLLKGKRSACHWAFVNQLARYGVIPDPRRFVSDDDGRFMSGGGVTSGIDFALRVAAVLSGKKVSELAQLIIEYDPDPPFKSGHPRSAPAEILAMAEQRLPGATRGLAKIPGIS